MDRINRMKGFGSDGYVLNEPVGRVEDHFCFSSCRIRMEMALIQGSDLNRLRPRLGNIGALSLV